MFFKETKLSDLSKGSIGLIIIGFLLVTVSMYVSIDLTLTALSKQKVAIDQAAFDFVRATSPEGQGKFFQWVSKTGSVPILGTASFLVAIYLLFLSPFSRWVGVYFVIAMGGVSSLTKLTKTLVERNRPGFLGDFHGATSSFPSGHASGAVVFYGFVVYMILASSLNKRWKWTLGSILALFPLGISVSRLYLGVHYFTDIIVGFLFGFIWLAICISGLEMTLWHQRKRQLAKR